MKWNAVIILALGFTHVAGANEDHHRLRGLVDLDSVPGHPHRELATCMQEVLFDPQACNANRCTSNDLQVVGASIELPSVCFTCTPCTEVTGELVLAIDNGTGSTRTTFGYGAKLVEQKDPACNEDPSNPPIECTDSRCQDGGALLPNRITETNFGTFTYTCGSRLFLEDIYQFWSPANAGSDCPSFATCKNIYPKCGVLESIEINPPLTIQEAAAGCDDDGTTNISIDVNVFGGTPGTPPYSYSWTDSTGTEVATTEDLTSVQDGVYTLTVTDSDPEGPCTTEKEFGPYNCCFFAATCIDVNDPTIECDDPLPDLLTQDVVFSYTGVVCGTLVFGASNTTVGGACPNEETITRTYTLLDDLNGNGELDEGEESQSCNQIITVQDTAAPVLSGVPADTTVECDSVPDPASPTATDNCDDVPSITFAEVPTDGDCADNYSLNRTWTATDECGNSASQSQIITVQDTTAPEIQDCPSDTSVDICNDPVPVAPVLTATDNCDETVTVDGPDCCFDGAGITRTWTATDRCGNSAMDCVQQITFNPTCV